MKLKLQSVGGFVCVATFAVAHVTAETDSKANQFVRAYDAAVRGTKQIKAEEINRRDDPTITSLFEPSRDPFASAIPREKLPQFILLTFDDAVTPQSIDLFRNSLDGVKSKEGCPIAATWYVSIAPSNNASPLVQCDLVKGLMKGKHEIATHTYGHTSNPTEEDIISAVDYLDEVCEVPREEIRGFRTPNLGFTQDTFDRLHEHGFLYDSSIADNGLGSRKGSTWLWPYTMDDGIAQDCISSAGKCDKTKSNPGLWEVPMWRMYDQNDRAMIVMDWPGNAYDTLSKNFQARYDGNRAPLGIYVHTSWLHLHGQELRQWATEVLNEYDDVYFVTNYELLQWMSNPVPSSEYQMRDCSDVVTDCFPPSAVEGRCGHGEYDSDKCECVCKHPWGGEKCLTQISHSWTFKPSPEPTVSPAPTSEPTVTPRPSTLAPTKGPSTPPVDSPTASPSDSPVWRLNAGDNLAAARSSAAIIGGGNQMRILLTTIVAASTILCSLFF